jgi:hypothetical protein
VSLFKQIWVERDPAYADYRKQVTGDPAEIISQYPYGAPLRRRNQHACSPYWDPIWPPRLRKASAELGLDYIVVNSRMMFRTEGARYTAIRRAQQLWEEAIAREPTQRARYA